MILLSEVWTKQKETEGCLLLLLSYLSTTVDLILKPTPPPPAAPHLTLVPPHIESGVLALRR